MNEKVEKDVVDGNEMVDEQAADEGTVDEQSSDEGVEEAEEVVQEEHASEESEDNKKLTIWEKILAFFKKLLYNISTWISNLIGGKGV